MTRDDKAKRDAWRDVTLSTVNASAYFNEAVTSLTEVARHARTMVAEAVRERPFTSLGAAGAIGFIVGGRITRPLMHLGMQVASKQVIHWALRDMTQGDEEDEVKPSTPREPAS